MIIAIHISKKHSNHKHQMNHRLDKMQSYDKYKPSNIDWISEIPSHWDTVSLKNVCNILPSNIDKHIFPEEIQVKLCNYTDVYYNEFIDSNTQLSNGSCSQLEYDKFLLTKDDVIITKDSESPNDIGIPTLIKEELANTVCGYHLTLIQPKSNITGGFTYRFIQSNGTKHYFEVNSNGITRYGLGKAAIENLKITLPPLTEQQAIVTYLDQKTTLIDELIAKKQSKIELLKEQRTALINHAVTKGLNTEVALKDSKIEWIGDIPEHWVIRRLSTFGIFSKGKGIRKDEVKDVGFPCIRYGEIYTKYDRVVYNPISCIDEETAKDSVVIEKGNVLFTGSGETLGEIGKSIVYYGEEKIFVGGDIIVLKLFKGINPLFVSYLMNANFLQFQKSLSGKGEIVVHIYSKNIREIITPLPPLSEQQAIVAYLDEQTELIDKNIDLESQKITTLKEYRQSLISAVVTGKICVIDN